MTTAKSKAPAGEPGSPVTAARGKWIRTAAHNENNRRVQRLAHPATPAHIKVLRRTLLDGDNCWEFEGAHNSAGYSIIGCCRGEKRTVQAHRVVYEAMKGPIPKGLTIDHLCQNTGCVNPDHMEPVTLAENLRRGHARRSEK
jgi:hypothetical protein